MLPETPQTLIESVLIHLEEISDLSDILLMINEQIDQNPEKVQERITFLTTNSSCNLEFLSHESTALLTRALKLLKAEQPPGMVAPLNGHPKTAKSK